MKRSSRAMTGAIALTGALTLMSAIRAEAAPLSPFGTQLPAIGEVGPVGGTVVATVSLPFASPTFSGTLTSTVLSGDMSNPYGGLTFTFVVDNDLGSDHPLGRLTLNGWDGWLADVSYDLGSIGVRPGIANRPVGDVIGFIFMDILGDGLVPAGKGSRVLVIQTDATQYTESIASVIDGFVATVPTFAPVPEPATLALMGAGMAALVFRRKR